MAKYKSRPPGSDCGDVCDRSLREASSSVNGVRISPGADARIRPDCPPKTIWPPGSQTPCLGRGVSHIVTGEPPETSTRCSLPFAENAIDLPSGDQKGYAALSVSGSSLAEAPARGRADSPVCPCPVATKAAVPPSGESGKPPTFALPTFTKLPPPGGSIWRWRTR